MHEIRTKEDLLKLGELQRGSLNIPPDTKLVLKNDIVLDNDLKFLGNVVIDGGEQKHCLTLDPIYLIKCSNMTYSITIKNVKLKASTLFKLNSRTLDALSLIGVEVYADSFGIIDLNSLRLVNTNFNNQNMVSANVLRLNSLVAHNVKSLSDMPILDVSNGVYLTGGVFANELEFPNQGGLLNIMNVDETNNKSPNTRLSMDSCFVDNVTGMLDHAIFQQRYGKRQYRSVAKQVMKYYMV